MQSLMNKPGSAITQSLRGMALCHPDTIKVHFDPDYVERLAPARSGKVAVISGSGSGHEPLPIGYVGLGMLDAACPGPIFTSPSPVQLLAAVHSVDHGGGVLFVVKNYSGGVLNTELTIELALQEGIDARYVLVNDDVSIPRVANRRGLGAATLACKIAGAAAESGYSLDAVVHVTRRAVAASRSMGVGTNVNTLPRNGPGENLADDSIELGVGIHGEPGEVRSVTKGMPEIVDLIVQPILDDLPFASGDSVLLLISGMGGTPPLELYLFSEAIHELLAARRLRVERQLIGNYLTCLGRGGYTISLMRLDDELLQLWDSPVHTPVLHW
ncbi:MAG: dihydroxyacetone kinase subunit DhaK [Caldilineaceae bacterium SB0670_bin_27]|uniref:Dihydroxyacetone kinase subunit DhaK n=1 Tax=Caldilineaceae bacterium SB0664_bin_27 TaxID=2605260 RepID=A0A6B0YU96_9CHLR|nr:dihydroxyacetone kinase subunit DhaK [Caldilineaceae bacterium SB0664_bin_27]MYJ78093.1 dihydroxyacetone kinase subunit DhaK [Caldilineaceae bacterium SB0670_bin_27]